MILQIFSVQRFFHEGVEQPFTLFSGAFQHSFEDLSQGHQTESYANGVHQ